MPFLSINAAFCPACPANVILTGSSKVKSMPVAPRRMARVVTSPPPAPLVRPRNSGASKLPSQSPVSAVIVVPPVINMVAPMPLSVKEMSLVVVI